MIWRILLAACGAMAVATGGSPASALAWAPDAAAASPASDIALGAPSGATRTEAWALLPEPVSWSILLLGLGGVGASLRARRRLVLGRSQAKMRGRR
ncbi:MAG TPA: hypothetical protein VKQ54_15150 [Caulobacteraceae bacterium]|nr:hypothetical protein [Caulobacteraceae bacterium]